MNFDLNKKKLTDINKYLQNIDRKSNVRKFKIENPSGHHAICAGLKDDIDVTINGHTGYYCAGMNQKASVTVNGNVGTGVAENMMSGKVFVKGNASQSAGATGHGGNLVIDGDASPNAVIRAKIWSNSFEDRKVSDQGDWTLVIKPDDLTKAKVGSRYTLYIEQMDTAGIVTRAEPHIINFI